MKSSLLMWRDKAGATSIEYGLTAAEISATIALALTVLGTSRMQFFSFSARQLDRLDPVCEFSNDRQGE
ncbi:Flp family type IVb pilin [Bradyrhizobium sp. RDM12]